MTRSEISGRFEKYSRSGGLPQSAIDLLNCALVTEVPAAKRVLKLRQQVGWTQARLAEHLGVTQATVNRWERGRKTPSPLAAGLIERLEDSIAQGRITSAEPPSSKATQEASLSLQLTIQLPVVTLEMSTDGMPEPPLGAPYPGAGGG